MVDAESDVARVFQRDFDALWREVRAAFEAEVTARNALAGELIVESVRKEPDQIVVAKVTLPAGRLTLEPHQDGQLCWAVYQRVPEGPTDYPEASVAFFVTHDDRLAIAWQDRPLTPAACAQAVLRGFLEWLQAVPRRNEGGRRRQSRGDAAAGTSRRRPAESLSPAIDGPAIIPGQG
jgi:hypothetical protein